MKGQLCKNCNNLFWPWDHCCENFVAVTTEELMQENKALRKANDSAHKLAWHNDDLIEENKMLKGNLESMDETNKALIKKIEESYLKGVYHCWYFLYYIAVNQRCNNGKDADIFKGEDLESVADSMRSNFDKEFEKDLLAGKYD